MHIDHIIKEEIEATQRVLTKLEIEYRAALLAAGVVGAETEYSPVADHLRGYVAALQERKKLSGPAWFSNARAEVRAAQFNGGWHVGRRWLVHQKLEAVRIEPAFKDTMLSQFAGLSQIVLGALT